MEKNKITNDIIVDNILYILCNNFFAISTAIIIFIGFYFGISTGDLIVKSGSVREGGEFIVKYVVGGLIGCLYILITLLIIIKITDDNDLERKIEEWYERRR